MAFIVDSSSYHVFVRLQLDGFSFSIPESKDTPCSRNRRRGIQFSLDGLCELMNRPVVFPSVRR